MFPGDKNKRSEAEKEKAHHYSETVAAASDDDTCRKSHQKISKIGRGLDQSGLGDGDGEGLLKMLVEDIEHRAGKTPHEEQRGDEDERQQILLFDKLSHGMLTVLNYTFAPCGAESAAKVMIFRQFGIINI